jgi:CopG family nickel-responsive transcriptional regulator
MSHPSLTRFGVSIDTDLIKKFDRYISRAGYGTRSEAIRDLIRARLVDEGTHDVEAQANGVLSLVYDHHKRELEDHLTTLQHDHHEMIIATTHVHLDHHNCLEVILLRGTVGKIRDIGAALASFKGVKHSSLSLTATRDLA